MKWAWLGAVGAAWFYETFALTTKKKPPITYLIQAQRHRRLQPPLTVGGCLAIAAVAICHLLIVKEIASAEVSSTA